MTESNSSKGEFKRLRVGEVKAQAIFRTYQKLEQSAKLELTRDLWGDGVTPHEDRPQAEQEEITRKWLGSPVIHEVNVLCAFVEEVFPIASLAIIVGYSKDHLLSSLHKARRVAGFETTEEMTSVVSELFNIISDQIAHIKLGEGEDEEQDEQDDETRRMNKLIFDKN